MPRFKKSLGCFDVFVNLSKPFICNVQICHNCAVITHLSAKLSIKSEICKKDGRINVINP